MKKKKILKFIRNLLIIFFGSSILSVIALRFIPVYFTPLMFIRTAHAVRQGPIYAGQKSDGSFGYQDNYSPEAWLASESFVQNVSRNISQEKPGYLLHREKDLRDSRRERHRWPCREILPRW